MKDKNAEVNLESIQGEALLHNQVEVNHHHLLQMTGDIEVEEIEITTEEGRQEAGQIIEITKVTEIEMIIIETGNEEEGIQEIETMIGIKETIMQIGIGREEAMIGMKKKTEIGRVIIIAKEIETIEEKILKKKLK